MRALGLDLGTRRIGVAVSDRSGTLASPLTVVERSSDADGDHRRIADLVREEEAEVVVVGLPLSMSGRPSQSSRSAELEAQALAATVPVPVVVWDERLTTVSASRSMTAAGVNTKKQRKSIDGAAAAVMLQSWLDRGDR